jgi:hypothetical protein
VLVNVPLGEWFCTKCRPDTDSHAARQAFQDLVENMKRDPEEQKNVAEFLNLPFLMPSDVYSADYFEDLPRFLQLHNWHARRKEFANCIANASEWNVNGVYLTGKVPDSVWSLPEPPPTTELYVETVTTLAAAMKEQKLEHFTDDLVYTDKAPRSMNDASLDEVEKLSAKNIEVFKAFKENTKNGMYVRVGGGGAPATSLFLSHPPPPPPQAAVPDAQVRPDPGLHGGGGDGHRAADPPGGVRGRGDARGGLGPVG